jgi:hypothetical protein
MTIMKFLDHELVLYSLFSLNEIEKILSRLITIKRSINEISLPLVK